MSEDIFIRRNTTRGGGQGLGTYFSRHLPTQSCSTLQLFSLGEKKRYCNWFLDMVNKDVDFQIEASIEFI